MNDITSTNDCCQYDKLTIEELKVLLCEAKKEKDEKTERLNCLARFQKTNAVIEQRFREKYGNAPHYYGGRYGTLYLHPDFDKWKGTFYETERLLFEEVLSKKVHPLNHVQRLKEGKSDIPALDAMNLPIKASIFGYCDYAKGTKNGPVLHLIDPDGEYTTPPFIGMPASMANLYAGKMCVVALRFQKDTMPKVLEVATLAYSLTGKIKNTDNLTEPPYISG